jgi:hypothetical protein
MYPIPTTHMAVGPGGGPEQGVVLVGRIVDGCRVGLDGAVLGDFVGNLSKFGANAAVRYGIIAFAVWKSLFNIPIPVIPTAQLMPIWPGSRLLWLSSVNSPFMYRTSDCSHWSSGTG